MQKIRQNIRSSERRRREREHQEIQTHKQMSNAFHWLFKYVCVCVCVLKDGRAIYAAKYSTSSSRGENTFTQLNHNILTKSTSLPFLSIREFVYPIQEFPLISRLQ